MKKILALLTAFTLILSAALAQEITLTEQSLVLSGNSVYYPQVTGMTDPALQEQINQQLIDSLGARDYITRMAMLMSNPVKLNVSSEAAVEGSILSAVLSAQGAVKNNRSTHVWTTAVMDLTTGESIPLDALFTQPAAAREAIEAYLDETLAPELSPHLSASALTPLPETFTVSPQALTLYYPIEQLATLSDRAGAVSLTWTELRPYLDLSDGSILTRLGAAQHLTLTAESRARLASVFASGELPFLNLTLGESMQALTDKHGMLLDPDIYEGGRMFQLEGAPYRQIYLLTDALGEDWDTSVLQGVRLDRMNLYGLCTGETTLAAWRSVLGEPETTVTVDAVRAEGWRIVPGQSDYYTFGEFRLRLHADESGVLRSVFLMQ